jgi:hypothetical protein
MAPIGRLQRDDIGLVNPGPHIAGLMLYIDAEGATCTRRCLTTGDFCPPSGLMIPNAMVAVPAGSVRVLFTSPEDTKVVTTISACNLQLRTGNKSGTEHIQEEGAARRCLSDGTWGKDREGIEHLDAERSGRPGGLEISLRWRWPNPAQMLVVGTYTPEVDIRPIEALPPTTPFTDHWTATGAPLTSALYLRCASFPYYGRTGDGDRCRCLRLNGGHENSRRVRREIVRKASGSATAVSSANIRTLCAREIHGLLKEIFVHLLDVESLYNPTTSAVTDHQEREVIAVDDAGINTAISWLKCSGIERVMKLLMWPPMTIVFRQGYRRQHRRHRVISWQMRGN